jgi:hypothetical protein
MRYSDEGIFMVDADERERILSELRRASRIMDSSIGIPGTKYTFGIDSLIGLIPGGGDAAGMLVSLYLIARARRLGLPKRTLAKMVGNMLVDAGVGAVPVVGDAFDFFFKANSRNLDLVLRALPPETPEVEHDLETDK